MHAMMGSTTSAALSGLLLSASVAGLAVSPRAAGRTISLPLYQDSNHLGYFANISVGTPPQTVRVTIDTGSADLWIFSNQVDCRPAGTCQGSSFNPDQSSSFQSVAPGDFLIEYAGGNGAKGDYISETVQIGGATVNNVVMGLASQAVSPNGLEISGIMGIGMLLEESLRSENNTGYFNLPYRLTAEGLIDETVFSVYLDDISSQSSNVLFGGVDSAKYDGELAVFNVNPTSAGLVQYLVPFTAVNLVGSQGNSTTLNIPSQFANGGVPALLDTGSTAMNLPQSIVEGIYEALPIEESTDGPVTPCALANSGTKLTFQLGGSSGPTINVNMAEVVRHSSLISDPDLCFFDIYPQSAQSDTAAVLGDAFLRNVYAVFDPGNAQIGIAQAKLNAANSNIQVLSQNAPVPTNGAILALGQLGNGASFGGGIPGSTVGGAPPSAVPSATAAVTAGLSPMSDVGGSIAPIATGASAASILAPSRASATMAGAGSATKATSAASMAATSGAPAQSAPKQMGSGTNTVAIPQFTGAAMGLMPPGLSSLVGLLAGAFILV